MSLRNSLSSAADDVCETIHDLRIQSREAQALRCDYAILEHQVADSFNNSMTEMMHSVARLEGTLKREISGDLEESECVKQQLTGLIKEKILVQEGVLNAAARVGTAENMLGCTRGMGTQATAIETMVGEPDPQLAE